MKQNTFLEMAKTEFTIINPWSLAVEHCTRHDTYFSDSGYPSGCNACERETADLEEFEKLCKAADYDSGDVAKGDK